MELTVKSPKVSEALLIWFFETWYTEVQRAHEKGPLHVPSAEARVLPALLQIEEKELRFQVTSNIVAGTSAGEDRLLAVLRTKPEGSGFCTGGDAPTYAWAYHMHGRDRVLMKGGTVLPVRAKPDPKIDAALMLSFFEAFAERTNKACVRIADAEPESHFAKMPSLLDCIADGNDFHIMSDLRVGTDMERLRFLNALRQVPKTMARWSGETEHEKVWALYILGPYHVLIVCRKVLTTSTAYYRSGGGGGGR